MEYSDGFFSCLTACEELNKVSFKSEYQAFNNGHNCDHLLGPFNIENKMIISKSWHSCNGSGCILPTVETDKGEALHESKWEAVTYNTKAFE